MLKTKVFLFLTIRQKAFDISIFARFIYY